MIDKLWPNDHCFAAAKAFEDEVAYLLVLVTSYTTYAARARRLAKSHKKLQELWVQRLSLLAEPHMHLTA
jgi:hypothetical protein